MGSCVICTLMTTGAIEHRPAAPVVTDEYAKDNFVDAYF